MKKFFVLLVLLALLGCNLFSGVPIQGLNPAPTLPPKPTTYDVLLVCTDCADIDRQINLWSTPSRKGLETAGQVPQNTRATVLQTARQDGVLYYQVRAGMVEGWISYLFVFPLSGPQPTQTPVELPARDAIVTMVAALPSLPPSPTFTLTPPPTKTPLPTPSFTPTPPPSACIPPGAPPVYGIVKRIVDGDTIIVDIQGKNHSVRYIGIDAPVFYPWGQFFGAQAKARNEELVLNRVVRLAADAVDQDEYGQLLRYVEAGDVFVNYALLRDGFARAHMLPQNFTCIQTFLAAEQAAQQEKLGLWQLVTSSPTSAATNKPVMTATMTQAAAATSTPTPTSATGTPGGTASLTPTSTPSRTITPTSTTGVIISKIFFDGAVPDVESDEYVVIMNISSSPVVLDGWQLYSDGAGQTFVFPDIMLDPGKDCRVYTNEIHTDSCGGKSFASETAIWNNEGDCGRLYNADDEVIYEYCYP